tara:strand:+ start:156 stop:575 length:420 start_codon:yes stop_codon:yes gene_type:complete
MDMLYENADKSLERVFNASNYNMMLFLDHMVKNLNNRIEKLETWIEVRQNQIETEEMDDHEKSYYNESIADAKSQLFYITSGHLSFKLLKEGKKTGMYGLAVSLPLVDVDEQFQYYANCIQHEAVKTLMFQGNPDIWVA